MDQRPVTAADTADKDMVTRAGEAADGMRALSNPSRLAILCLLGEGERTVSEIEQTLGLDQAYTSQQLARLRQQELVTATRDGRTMRYNLSEARLRPILETVYDQFCSR